MKYETASTEDMQALGEKLAASLKGGEVIELIGDVGAGKTTFTKGLAKGLGVSDDVQSPSFTLSRQYEADGGLMLSHYDFYRLSDPGILALELADIMSQPGNITVIEWADIVEGVLPENRITIKISSPTETDRSVEISGVEL